MDELFFYWLTRGLFPGKSLPLCGIQMPSRLAHPHVRLVGLARFLT